MYSTDINKKQSKKFAMSLIKKIEYFFFVIHTRTRKRIDREKFYLGVISKQLLVIRWIVKDSRK